MATAQQNFDRGNWLASIFLIIGLAATGLAWWEGKKLVEQELASQLDARASDARNSLERQIGEYTEVLRGYQAQFSARPDLTRDAFQRATQSLDLEGRLPGIQAVGFSPRTANEGSFPVRYIEPIAHNSSGIGYDQGADAKRRIAIDRMRDTGELAASERIRLFIEPGNIDGVVFFLPLYHGGGIPATITERREQLSGLVFLATRADEMLRAVFGAPQLDDLNITVEHVSLEGTDTANAAGQPIYDSRSPEARKVWAPAAGDLGLNRQVDVAVGGTIWRMNIAAKEQFIQQSQTWLPFVTAMAGTLLSLFVFFAMRALNASRNSSEKRARAVESSLHSRDRQLTEIMGSINEVLWTSRFPEGTISYVSPAVERVYGRPAEAFYQSRRLWLECIHPEDRDRVVGFVKKVKKRGQSSIHYRIVRPDGTVRWLRYAVNFVQDASKAIVRVNSVGSDVTDEYLLEQSLRRSHRALLAIHDCKEKTAIAEDEHALLQGICEVVVNAGYRLAWVGLLLPDDKHDHGASLRMTNIAGQSQSYVENIKGPLADEPEKLSTIERALRTQRAATANNFQQEAHIPWRAAALGHGLHAKAALPLIQNGKVIGVLNVYAGEVEAFDSEELGLLESLAQSVIAALQSLREHTLRKKTEAALHLRQRAIEASANAIVITNATKPNFPVEYVNPAFESMTGYNSEEILGKSLRFLRRDDHDQTGIVQIRAILAAKTSGHATMRNYRKDGTMFWSQVYIAPVKDDAGTVTHFVAAKYDVTEMKRYQAELEFQANHDALTNLANRKLLQDHLRGAIMAADKGGPALWVAFLDLDNFKYVNDSLGHGAGDVLLQKMAGRLEHAVRPNDIVARQGGDEFVLILREHKDNVSAPALLQRVMEVIAQPVQINGHTFYPTCSIGVAVYPDDGDDPDTLIKHADIAMYRAKEAGRDNFQFFTAGLNEKALERLQLETDLRNAIDRNELLLHYQPQVSLQTGRVVGMEALIRWAHPSMGMIAPSRFISLAEETGLIVPIGDWVIREACRQNKAWQDAGLPALRIAVNLSARQFAEDNLVPFITATLEETGLDPRYLEIELTESMVISDVKRTIGILKQLKALGLQISIDDFGTGYSSLSSLKRFPIDVLKIDQSFVRDITVDPDGAAIVTAIISLGHSLNLQVIAEGVETTGQLAYLEERGCDLIQGYLFSRPLDTGAFQSLILEDKTLPLKGATLA
ncbi:MAG TPA: EAL domain-containing protein [Candidimonas sp.]|nr:EAL domain-containing protein [Candidimonas sp.]